MNIDWIKEVIVAVFGRHVLCDTHEPCLDMLCNKEAKVINTKEVTNSACKNELNQKLFMCNAKDK